MVGGKRICELLSGLLSLFRGYSSRLNPYELAIVDAVVEALPPSNGEKLRRYARAVNRVYRHDGGRIIYIYLMLGGKSLSPKETAISGLPRTAKFAKVLVKSSDDLSRLKAVLYLVDGNLFEIEFDRPAKFAEVGSIKATKVTILGPPFFDPDEQRDVNGDWPVETFD